MCAIDSQGGKAALCHDAPPRWGGRLSPRCGISGGRVYNSRLAGKRYRNAFFGGPSSSVGRAGA